MIMEEPLVNIEEEGPEWLEWCAALYESYASDREWSQQVTYLPATGTYSLPAVGSALASLGDYCTAAHALCESLEFMIYQERQNKIEFDR
jgi:predicted PhzF superfamily epimerase YddE/YHI9